MKHLSTIISFNDKGINYIVKYKNRGEEISAEIVRENITIKKFSKIPYTKTSNPTKTQAIELIKIALKEEKANAKNKVL